MNMVRWNPITEMDEMLRRSFAPNWNRATASEAMAEADFVPAVDIRESGSGYEIEVELAAVDPADVTVDLRDGVLSVRGERRRAELGEGVKQHRAERRFGRFSRLFVLPEDADPDAIGARAHAGVLTITVASGPRCNPDRSRSSALSPRSRSPVGKRSRASAGGGNTPAIRLLVSAAVEHRVHEYAVAERDAGWGEEAIAALGLVPQQVFKTLVIALDGDARRLGVAVLPVPSRLALKRAAAALGARSARLADMTIAERSTGYVAGGISPLGQRSVLPTVIDASALSFERIFCSAGRRGLELEIAPATLIELTDARVAELIAGG